MKHTSELPDTISITGTVVSPSVSIKAAFIGSAVWLFSSSGSFSPAPFSLFSSSSLSSASSSVSSASSSYRRNKIPVSNTNPKRNMLVEGNVLEQMIHF